MKIFNILSPRVAIEPATVALTSARLHPCTTILYYSNRIWWWIRFPLWGMNYFQTKRGVELRHSTRNCLHFLCLPFFFASFYNETNSIFVIKFIFLVVAILALIMTVIFHGLNKYFLTSLKVGGYMYYSTHILQNC